MSEEKDIMQENNQVVDAVPVSQDEAETSPVRVVMDEQALASVDPGAMEGSNLQFTEAVIEKITSIAAADVPGILGMTASGFLSNLKGLGGYKGINAEIKDNEVTITTEVILEFGRSAPKVFEELKDRIGRAITLMTGLKVVAVNTKVVNVMTREEFEKK